MRRSTYLERSLGLAEGVGGRGGGGVGWRGGGGGGALGGGANSEIE